VVAGEEGAETGISTLVYLLPQTHRNDCRPQAG